MQEEAETGGAQLSRLPRAADIAALADPAPERWAFLLIEPQPQADTAALNRPERLAPARVCCAA